LTTPQQPQAYSPPPQDTASGAYRGDYQQQDGDGAGDHYDNDAEGGGSGGEVEEPLQPIPMRRLSPSGATVSPQSPPPAAAQQQQQGATARATVPALAAAPASQPRPLPLSHGAGAPSLAPPAEWKWDDRLQKLVPVVAKGAAPIVVRRPLPQQQQQQPAAASLSVEEFLRRAREAY
jgi:hypothetical protein